MRILATGAPGRSQTQRAANEALMSSNDALRKTPLFDWHRTHGGRLVEFGGWSMPVQYTTITAEHTAVRERVGLFDISHMGRLTFDGPDVLGWLDRVTTNHVARLADLQIQYSLLTNDQGGVIDDVTVYRQPFAYIVVCNASNRDRVRGQFERLRKGALGNFLDRTLDTAMIAVQGPRSLETLEPLFDQPLAPIPYYHFTMGRLSGGVNAVVSRTGYTGEDGFELIIGASAAPGIWDALLESGKPHDIAPCGLGARDTLRIEAAMALYGHELSESIDPFAAGVGWAVKLEKGDFVGSEALKVLKAKPRPTRAGLKLEGKRIAREGSLVFSGDREAGKVSSGTFSPTLATSLAMAYLDPSAAAIGTALAIEVRGHREPAQVVKLPFYKRPRATTPAG
jgi:aminomethyltransferase